MASLERQVDRYKEAFAAAQEAQHRLREELDIATIEAAKKEMDAAVRGSREGQEEAERLRGELERVQEDLREANEELVVTRGRLQSMVEATEESV